MNTVTVHITLKNANKLEHLSRVTKKTPSMLISEALDAYLETQEWQIDRSPDEVEVEPPAEPDEAALAQGMEMVLEVEEEGEEKGEE